MRWDPRSEALSEVEMESLSSDELLEERPKESDEFCFSIFTLGSFFFDCALEYVN